MKTLTSIIVVVVALSSLNVLTAQDTSVVFDKDLNNSSEAYALAFRNLPGQMEAWLTVAPTSGSAKRVLALSTCGEGGFGTPTIFDDQELNSQRSAYNGVPTFNPCDPNEAIIVSDRIAKDQSRYSNDLYLMSYNNGRWLSTRMSINSSSWDDTPSFGTNGNSLYFASDRRNPGRGAGDIYVSHRDNGLWSEPELLKTICSVNDHESSPFVSRDGTLYYTTNRDGSQDIWSVSLGPDGMPNSEPVKLQMDGVNLDDSDEYHPMITPGGNFFVFSSNRSGFDGNTSFRLYHKQLPQESTTLKLTVTARTVIRDKQKIQFFGKLDSIYAVNTDIGVVLLPTERQDRLKTSADGVASITFDPNRVGGPFADLGTRTIVARAFEHQRGYMAGIDTLVLDLAGCGPIVEHTLYLDDTLSKSRTCDFSFRTFNVPFFITTYWCPTTKKFRSYTPCTSLFVDDLSCTEPDQPEYCETNEAYSYEFIPARVVRTNRRSENCVNYPEFESRGAGWADEVDANIERMRDEVRAALSESCIQEAIRKKHIVSITYVGTTDDRSIGAKCEYTGQDYQDIKTLAPDIEIAHEIESFIKTGQKFNAGGYGGKAGGNQLLSDLRSLYFAILFDNLCRETIPVYRTLRESGLMRVLSRGEAIDQRDLPYEFKRAAGVEIEVPDYEAIAAGMLEQQHRTIYLGQSTERCR